MASWHRLSAFALVAASLMAPATVLAQSPEQQAEKLNDEGKKLWKENKDIPAAVEKFNQAVVLSRKAKYYTNLCYGLHQIARYEEALSACRAVRNAEEPTDRMIENAERVIADIKKRAPELFEERPDGNDGGNVGNDGTGNDGNDGTGNDGNDGTGNDGTGNDGTGNDGNDGNDGTGNDGNDGGNVGTGPTGTPVANRPPPGPILGLQGEAPPADSYNWSLGVDLGFLANGMGDVYAGGGFLTRVHGSYLFSPNSRIGVRGFIGLSQVGADNPFGDSLEIFDFGASLFKHARLGGLHITPAVGAQIAAITPTDSFAAAEDSLGTVGLHAEAAISWLFGSDKRHVLSITPTLSVYLPSTASAGGIDPADFGLDRPGATFAISFGYTLRFLTPFGTAPFFTLE